MTPAKIETKLETTFEIGAKLDDMLEGARREFHQNEGAKNALGLAAKRLEEHQKVADKELDEGLMDKEQHNIVKKYVDQCGGIVRNLFITAEIQMLQAQGRVSALEAAVGIVKKMHDDDVRRLDMLRDAVKRGIILPEEEAPQKDEIRHIEHPLKDRKGAAAIVEETPPAADSEDKG